MRLRYTRTVLRQIEEALAYIDARSPQGAVSLRERILAVAALIQEHPFAGQSTSRTGVRRVAMTDFPYVMFYRVEAQEIIVTRFRHTARKP